jgi:hypothetical protein
MANGYKVKAVYMVGLNWNGGSASSFDVDRDGSHIALGVSGNYYTEDLGKKADGSYLYRVCVAGSQTICSNTVQVDF